LAITGRILSRASAHTCAVTSPCHFRQERADN
jgi:hypothetical protein